MCCRGGKVPKVMALRDVLRRMARPPQGRAGAALAASACAKSPRGLEILGGYLIAYLNLDEVIRIIREEDEPKPTLMERFNLTDNQAEAILNMRLRALRKLEEMEIRKEHDALTKEQRGLKSLLKSDDDQWAKIANAIKEIKEKFSKKTELWANAAPTSPKRPKSMPTLEQALIEKEPVTVVCSEKGWIRAMKGHMEDVSGLAYKEGDRSNFVFPAQTTDRIMLFSSSGKFFTLDGGEAAGRPRPRRAGAPHVRSRRRRPDRRAVRPRAWSQTAFGLDATAMASSSAKTNAWPIRARASRC